MGDLEAPDIPSGRLDLDAIEPFTQVTLRRGPVTLVPGVRMSWSREWGTYSSPRLSAMVKGGGGWTFRGAVARGFRAPDGKELGLEFLNVGPGFAYLVRGNADLRPETSVNVTTGVEWSGRRFWGRGRFHTNSRTSSRPPPWGFCRGPFTYENLCGVEPGVEVSGGEPRRPPFEGGWSSGKPGRGGEAAPGAPATPGGWSARPPSSLRAATGTGPGGCAGADGRGIMIRRGPRLDARLTRDLPGALSSPWGDNLLDARPRDGLDPKRPSTWDSPLPGAGFAEGSPAGGAAGDPLKAHPGAL